MSGSRQKVLLVTFVAISLAYIVGTWLLLCIYVSLPFTVVGSFPRVSFLVFELGFTVLFLLFLLLGILARRKDGRQEAQDLVVIGFLLLQARLFALSAEQFGTAWINGDEATKMSALANGVGTLGIGWAVLLWPFWLLALRRLWEPKIEHGEKGTDGSGQESKPG